MRAPAAVLLLLLATATAAAPARRLAGAVPRGLARMTAVGRARDDLPLDQVTVFLGLRDQAGLDAVLAAQQDPRSPRFDRWLDPDEIADRFGPTRAEYVRVRAWLAGHGFLIVRDSPFRAFVTVAGTAAQAARALKAPIGLFRHHGRTYHAPLAEPALPAALAASVRGVVGLDDLPHFRPLLQLSSGTAGCLPGQPCTALGPADFAAQYNVASLQSAGLTGAGRSIAVVARSNYPDADVALFDQRFLTVPRALPTRVVASRDPGISSDQGELIEVLIDAQWSGAVAPGAAVNMVIGSPRGDLFEALVKATDDRLGDVISLSFGLCESASPLLAEVFDAVYAIANAQGQTVLVASGDFGASDCLASDPPTAGLAVNGLASSPHAVAVGGSAFALASDGALVPGAPERTWNDGFFAGGGGESVLFARPQFQFGPGVPARRGRLLPDLAVAGDPALPGYVIVSATTNHVVGGTSVGAPALAGALALVNEAQGRRGLGQLTPSLYRLGGEQALGLRAPVFRDLVAGTIQVESSGGYTAGPGFDLATGWGAPQVDALATTVGGTARCEPEIACLVPAGGAARACAGEWLVERDHLAVRKNGIPRTTQTCRDGDPECDADGAVDGRCTVNVALCLNVFDFRRLNKRGLPVCARGTIRRLRLLSARGTRNDPVVADNQRTLAAALRALPSLPSALRAACTAAVPVVVPVAARHGTTLRARVQGARGATVPRITLRCTAG